ncbi:MAG: DUF736 domain-containing protein [Desulfurellales bacterium]|nr:MAG: DUF736 domain-containing protein [Desulfurellales bacterium]
MAGNYDDSNRGALFNNKRKEKDTHPDFTGKGNYAGTDFEVSGWKKKDRNGNPYISLSFKEPYRKPEQMDDIRDDF